MMTTPTNHKTNQQQLMRCPKCSKVMFANHFNGHILPNRRNPHSIQSICEGVRRAYPNGLTAVDFKALYDEAHLTDPVVIAKIRNGTYEHTVSRAVLDTLKPSDGPVREKIPVVKVTPTVVNVAAPKPPPKATVVASVPPPSPSSESSSSSSQPSSPIAQRLRRTGSRQNNAASYTPFFYVSDDDDNDGEGGKIVKKRQASESSSSSDKEDASFKPNSSDFEDNFPSRAKKGRQQQQQQQPKQQKKNVGRFTGIFPSIIPKMLVKPVATEPQQVQPEKDAETKTPLTPPAEDDPEPTPSSVPPTVPKTNAAATAAQNLAKCGLCGSTLSALAMLRLPCCYRQRTCLWCIVGACRRGEFIKCSLCRFALAPPINEIGATGRNQQQQQQSEPQPAPESVIVVDDDVDEVEQPAAVAPSPPKQPTPVISKPKTAKRGTRNYGRTALAIDDEQAHG